MTISRTADHLYECLMLDIWPRHSAMCDFGLDHPESGTRYAWLQRLVREAGCTPDDLHRVAGSGPDITRLLDRHFPDYIGKPTFTTAYDAMEEDWCLEDDYL